MITHADVGVKFQERAYSVLETGGAVSVCTIIDGVPERGLARDLTVVLTAVDGQSAGLLYLYILKASRVN